MSTYEQAINGLINSSKVHSNNTMYQFQDATRIKLSKIEETNQNIAKGLKMFSPILEQAHLDWVEQQKQEGRDLVAEREISLLKLEQLEQETQRLKDQHTDLEFHLNNEISEEAILQRDQLELDISEAEAQEAQFRVDQSVILKNQLESASNWTLAEYYKAQIVEFGETLDEKIAQWFQNNDQEFEYNGLKFKPIEMDASWPPDLKEAAWNLALEQIMKAEGMDDYSPELLAYAGLTSTPPRENQPARIGSIETLRTAFMAQARAEHVRHLNEESGSRAVSQWHNSPFFRDLTNPDFTLEGNDEAAIRAGKDLQGLLNSAIGQKDAEGNIISSNAGAWDYVLDVLARDGVTNDRLVDQLGEMILPASMVSPGNKGCTTGDDKGKLKFKCVYGNKLTDLEVRIGERVKIINEDQKTIRDGKFARLQLALQDITDPIERNEKIAEALWLAAQTGHKPEWLRNISVDSFNEASEALIKANIQEVVIQDPVTGATEKKEVLFMTTAELDALGIDVPPQYRAMAEYYETSYQPLVNGHLTKAIEQIETTLESHLGLDSTTQRNTFVFEASKDYSIEAYKAKYNEVLPLRGADAAHEEAMAMIIQDLKSAVEGEDPLSSQYIRTTDKRFAEARALGKVNQIIENDIGDTRLAIVTAQQEDPNLNIIDGYLSPNSTKLIPGSEGYLQEYITAISTGRAIPDYVWTYYEALAADTRYVTPRAMMRIQHQIYTDHHLGTELTPLTRDEVPPENRVEIFEENNPTAEREAQIELLRDKGILPPGIGYGVEEQAEGTEELSTEGASSTNTEGASSTNTEIAPSFNVTEFLTSPDFQVAIQSMSPYFQAARYSYKTGSNNRGRLYLENHTNLLAGYPTTFREPQNINPFLANEYT